MGAIALICKQTGMSGGAAHKGRDMSCMSLGHRVSAALPVGPGFGVETKNKDCVSSSAPRQPFSGGLYRERELPRHRDTDRKN